MTENPENSIYKYGHRNTSKFRNFELFEFRNMQHYVKAVFERLAAKNWHVKEKKCALFLPEVKFLGHIVSAAGVRVAVDKVDAVASWPTLTCVHEV